jgi:DNA-directed RNA polymerase
MAWERQMQTFGSELYDQRNEGKEASNTATGKSVLRKHISAATASIEQAQANVIGGQQRAERTARGTIVMIPADTLAVIALRNVIDQTCTVPEPDTGSPFSSVSRLIGRAVATELNYRHWITSSCDSAEAYAESLGIPTPKSFAEKLIAEQGVTPRNLRQWAKSFEELVEYEWSDLSEYYCGDTLLHCVVTALPDCFETHSPWRRGKPVKCVRMLPEFLNTFNDREARLAVIQSIRKPMLTIPQPWSSI